MAYDNRRAGNVGRVKFGTNSSESCDRDQRVRAADEHTHGFWIARLDTQNTIRAIRCSEHDCRLVADFGADIQYGSDGSALPRMRKSEIARR